MLEVKQRKRDNPEKAAAKNTAMKEMLKSKMHRLNVEIDHDLFVRVRDRAQQNDTKVSAVIRELLEQYARK
jgi:hypothetical protein